MSEVLSPLEAYELSMEQKMAQAAAHMEHLARLWAQGGAGAQTGMQTGMQPGAWVDFGGAVTARLAEGESLADAIRRAYPDVAIRHGLRRIDPAEPSFEHELGLFFAHYEPNFPLPDEQESLAGFRKLLSDPPLPTGYEERAYSVVCPLTGRYLFGFNFTIQAQSATAHAIYGFVMPWARQRFGFGRRMVALIRRIASEEIVRHFAQGGAGRPADYLGAEGPLILFEKNVLTAMRLADILRDSAGIDIALPPHRGDDLSRSGVGQSLRDLAWHHLGGKVVGYHYIQSSLDGIVRFSDADRPAIVAALNGGQGPHVAEALMAEALGEKEAGCTTLELCAFVPEGTTDVAAAQVRRSNEIFQEVSVVKQPGIGEDIYFQAQMDSLDRNTRSGRVGLRPIRPAAAEGATFEEAEQLTRSLLSRVDWEALQEAPDRTYGEWLARTGLG